MWFFLLPWCKCRSKPLFQYSILKQKVTSPTWAKVLFLVVLKQDWANQSTIIYCSEDKPLVFMASSCLFLFLAFYDRVKYVKMVEKQKYFGETLRFSSQEHLANSNEHWTKHSLLKEYLKTCHATWKVYFYVKLSFHKTYICKCRR